jgi:hypothetical protein
LLDGVVKAANEMGVNVRCIQKPSEVEPDQPRLRFAKKNADLFDAIGSSADVAGGTAWLWASPDAAESVDVLFIDEAAQMALANVLAVSQAATSIVLLGDPQPLRQDQISVNPSSSPLPVTSELIDVGAASFLTPGLDPCSPGVFWSRPTRRAAIRNHATSFARSRLFRR